MVLIGDAAIENLKEIAILAHTTDSSKKLGMHTRSHGKVGKSDAQTMVRPIGYSNAAPL